jgi:hypothetical protein
MLSNQRPEFRHPRQGHAGWNLTLPNNLPAIGAGIVGAGGSEARTADINSAKKGLGK